jgi:hypothetical protein
MVPRRSYRSERTLVHSASPVFTPLPRHCSEPVKWHKGHHCGQQHHPGEQEAVGQGHPGTARHGRVSADGIGIHEPIGIPARGLAAPERVEEVPERIQREQDERLPAHTSVQRHDDEIRHHHLRQHLVKNGVLPVQEWVGDRVVDAVKQEGEHEAGEHRDHHGGPAQITPTREVARAGRGACHRARGRRPR